MHDVTRTSDLAGVFVLRRTRPGGTLFAVAVRAHNPATHGERLGTMLAVGHKFRAAPNVVAALSVFFCALLCDRAGAEDTAALRLLRTIQNLQAEHGFLAPELLPPLVELGQLYAAGQCDRALDILDLALEVSRRSDGLFNTTQLDIYASLIHCYQTLDRPAELKRAQQYVLLIHESHLGESDRRLLPILERAARTYEEAGLYLSARRLHRRAADIAERLAGKSDVALIAPLRGMARAFRLEYAYGLAAPDLVDLPIETSDLRSRAIFDDNLGTRLDPLGQRSLERAVAILREYADQPARVADSLFGNQSDLYHAYLATLLELGDWYQLANNRKEALRTYRELWRELRDTTAKTDGTGNIGENPLSTAESLLARPDTGRNLRRPPLETDRYQKYTIDLAFTVSGDGWVKDVRVIESNAPRQFEMEATHDLQRTRFRPRFLDGNPVDTPNLHHRQNIYVAQTRPADAEVAAK